MQASPDFLDRDGTDPWLDTGPAKSSDTFDCGTSAQSVDQHGGIEQEPRHTQPVRWSSLCRCARTQARGSLSHSWPVSAIVPSEASMSSHLRSSSSPRRISAAMNALRFRGPARRSKSATRSSSRCMCILMCFSIHTALGTTDVRVSWLLGGQAELMMRKSAYSAVIVNHGGVVRHLCHSGPESTTLPGL